MTPNWPKTAIFTMASLLTMAPSLTAQQPAAQQPEAFARQSAPQVTSIIRHVPVIARELAAFIIGQLPDRDRGSSEQEDASLEDAINAILTEQAGYRAQMLTLMETQNRILTEQAEYRAQMLTLMETQNLTLSSLTDAVNLANERLAVIEDRLPRR